MPIANKNIGSIQPYILHWTMASTRCFSKMPEIPWWTITK